MDDLDCRPLVLSSDMDSAARGRWFHDFRGLESGGRKTEGDRAGAAMFVVVLDFDSTGLLCGAGNPACNLLSSQA
jgi:hypothetical protein